MRSPEMSHSPAYHQAQDSISSVPSSIFASRPCRSVKYPEKSHSGGPLRCSDEWMPTCEASPSPSSPRGSHAYSPEASRRHSRVEDGSPVTRILASSSSVAQKEESSQISWADQPSFMSAEQAGSLRGHERDASEDVSGDDGQDALLMLYHLSISVPIFSLCASLYTCLALIFALFSSPLRLCSISNYLRDTTFSIQLRDLLSPCLHIHERLVRMRPMSDRSSTQWICSASSPYQPSILADSNESYSIGTSIAVLLLSPFLSIVIILFAWTAAFFWVFSMVMGNPDGTERKDDGRAAVVGVCNWWRTWLGKARTSWS